MRYRNIWVRDLGEPGKAEFTLPNAALDGFCGVYERDGNRVAEVRRKLGQRRFQNVELVVCLTGYLHSQVVA